MKPDTRAYFKCTKDDVKSVKQHTKTWHFVEKIYVSMQEIRPKCKVCELRNRPTFFWSTLQMTIVYKACFTATMNFL